MQACYKAMRMNHILVTQEYDSALTKVSKLERSTALKKVAAISLEDMHAIVKGVTRDRQHTEGWGGRHMPLVR